MSVKQPLLSYHKNHRGQEWSVLSKACASCTKAAACCKHALRISDKQPSGKAAIAAAWGARKLKQEPSIAAVQDASRLWQKSWQDPVQLHAVQAD